MHEFIFSLSPPTRSCHNLIRTKPSKSFTQSGSTQGLKALLTPPCLPASLKEKMLEAGRGRKGEEQTEMPIYIGVQSEVNKTKITFSVVHPWYSLVLLGVLRTSMVLKPKAASVKIN